jgi:hypothetical protein
MASFMKNRLLIAVTFFVTLSCSVTVAFSHPGATLSTRTPGNVKTAPNSNQKEYTTLDKNHAESRQQQKGEDNIEDEVKAGIGG